VLSTVVFNIGPSIFDIVAASIYVAAQLNMWVAIIVFVTMASYIPITVSPPLPPLPLLRLPLYSLQDILLHFAARHNDIL